MANDKLPAVEELREALHREINKYGVRIDRKHFAKTESERKAAVVAQLNWKSKMKTRPDWVKQQNTQTMTTIMNVLQSNHCPTWGSVTLKFTS